MRRNFGARELESSSSRLLLDEEEEGEHYVIAFDDESSVASENGNEDRILRGRTAPTFVATAYTPQRVQFQGYSPLQPAVPSAPVEPSAPYSEPPRQRTVSMLASPNISQPRSSALRKPFSVDSRHRSKNVVYTASAMDLAHVEGASRMVQAKEEESEDEEEDRRTNNVSYGAAKYLPSVSVTPIRLQTFNVPSQRPSRMSLESPMSQSSFHSSSTTSSRRFSMMSHRSSTSMSLLFGEVINLEDTARFGTAFSGTSDRADIDVESGLEGIVIGGGQRTAGNVAPKQALFSDNGTSSRHPIISIGLPIESLSIGLTNVQRLGQTTTRRISEMASRARLATQSVIHAYRPPLSPHARALEDLDYLQQTHKEKVGQLTENAEVEEHYDFVLLLKPQEVYRFWAHILDFRVEHLGDEFQAAMDPMVIETASTNSTESRDSFEIEDEYEPLRHHMTSTPATGMRRRPSKSPSKDDDSASLPMSPLSRVMMMPPSNPNFSSPSTRRSGHSIALTTTGKRLRQRQSLFERALGVPSSPIAGAKHVQATPGQVPSTETPMRRRWGNRAGNSSVANLLSPPVRSITRGESSVRKIRAKTLEKPKASAGGDSEVENKDPNKSDGTTEEFPNPIIPRGIAARTNGMLPFLSALKRGFVVRRHRPGKEAIYCKIFSNNGGDTIQYHLVDTAEAMVAFKEQRIRHNRDLVHSNSPTAAERASIPEWASLDEDESFLQNFNVPDHVAASRYRERVAMKNMKKKILEVATKAANSGIIRASDLVAVHPASHHDPRHPGVRRGDLGTATLRKSKSVYDTAQTFSIVVNVSQRLATTKGQGKTKQKSERDDNKWYSGEGSEIHFKTMDFEAASQGEYWLIFRGFLLLQRDVVVGRFAANRRAGIGGGNWRGEDQPIDDLENILHRDEFLEPVTVGSIERAVVNLRKLDKTYMQGAVVPGAVPPPSDYFLGFKSPGTQIWSRLRLAGLETNRVYSVDSRRVMIKIRCPEDRLTDVAEVLRVKMKTIQGTYAPFREDAAHLFRQLNDPQDVPALYQGQMASLLRSKDRQSIIDFIIGSRIRDSGAELGPTTDVGKMVQARVPLHMHSKLESLFRPWVFYWRKENWESPAALRTSYSDEENGVEPDDSDEPTKDATKEEIPNFITRLFVGAFHQPLDAVEEYFGEKVTFYFAWLQHCARHLLVLTILGMIVTFCQLASNNIDHPIRPFFSIVVMIWTFMVLLNWRRRSNLLAYNWGSIDYKDKETPRPEFHGEYVVDEITGEWVVKYPAWKRWVKYAVSIPINLFFTTMAALLILLVHANRDLQMANYITQRQDPTSEPFEFKVSIRNIGKPAELVEVEMTKDLVKDPTFWLVMGALPALLGLCIPILNLILMKISVILNDFENYRTESEYRTHLIIKVFGFRFVSQFGTLFYYAAISIGDEHSVQNGLVRMGTSLMIYTTVSHWWSIFLQVYFFMFIRNIRRHLYRRKLHQELKSIELEEENINTSLSDAEARQARLINKRMLLDQAQDDIWFELMNPAHDSFPEYITAVLQFSFVACFSVVLPITPLFCLFNYLLSMRYDAYKLCRGRRRPLAQKTGGIGVWEHLLHIVAVVSVLTNCWLIAFTTADFAWIKQEVGQLGLFAIVVAWEHSMLLIKYVMQTSMSPLPRVVRDKLKREQHSRDKERYTAMRTKDLGRRGKGDRKGRSLSSVHFQDTKSSSPGLETIVSYESIISDTDTVSA